MRLHSKLTLFITSLIFFNCTSEKEKTLQLNGTVVNTDIKSFILVKPNQDTRFDSIIEIPVIDGKFHYETKLKQPEAVSLFLTKDLGRFMPLFLENDNIELTIYPEEDFDKNVVEGGKLNKEFKTYKENLDLKFNSRLRPIEKIMDSLYKNDQFQSDKMKDIFAELKEAKSQDEKIVLYKKMEMLSDDGLDKTQFAKEMSDKLEMVYKDIADYDKKYIEKNQTLVSYSFFLRDLIFNKEKVDVNSAKNIYRKLSNSYPNHTYNDLALNLITSIEKVKIGKEYVDFSAPDMNGNLVKLSDKINGQVALLDLWATWCGPCIAKSRTMIPIYNEYKDKGFTIVGVAGEFENTDRLVKFLEKEKWGWLNLVELDRQNSIWEKYGVDGGGGGIFLIDEEGKILAKDPTADEVREELESRLN